MASTNKTTNYNLSQFIGSDKPAWLTDYNQDMSKIDTGIKNAADTATGADGKADANTTAIGTIANLTTTNKTDLVVAINEVDAHADTAQQSADTAAASATTANTTANALNTYFTLNDFGTFTCTTSGATLSSTYNNLSYASNASGSLGKIYGMLVLDPTATTVTITGQTPFRPNTAITINGVAWGQYNSQSQSFPGRLLPRSFTIGTDGSFTLTMTGTAQNEWRIYFSACLLFFKDFGDVPIPD